MLASRFDSLLKGYAYEDSDDSRTYRPTLSLGLVVAHHLDPLQDALERAREAERKAKTLRNALAVTESPRSGVDRTVSGPWGTLEARLLVMRDLHRLEAVPDRAAYDLAEMARVLERVNPEAAMLEALRILKRKKVRRGEERIASHHVKILRGYLQSGLGVGDLARELIISRIFAEAAAMAGLPVRDPLAVGE
jgi:CRISPR-associated protein Cmr2